MVPKGGKHQLLVVKGIEKFIIIIIIIICMLYQILEFLLSSAKNEFFCHTKVLTKLFDSSFHSLRPG